MLYVQGGPCHSVCANQASRHPPVMSTLVRCDIVNRHPASKKALQEQKKNQNKKNQNIRPEGWSEHKAE